MIIECSKHLLTEYVNIVLKAVSSRTTLPILECVLMIADENGFRLIGNDLELGIETVPIDADVLEQGCVALDAKMLSAIVSRLPGEMVSIKSTDQNITIIKSGKAEFKIVGQNGGEFPFLPHVEKTAEYRLLCKDFKEMIRQTIFSVSVDDSKPVMTGELLKIRSDKITLAAIDGFRVSVRTLETGGGIDEGYEIKCVIPSKTLNELSKLFSSDESASVSIYITSKHALFEMENCTVVTRLIDGDFMSYENLFNTEYTTLVTIEKELMLNALERASLISKDGKKNPVKFTITENMFIITSNTQAGTCYEELAVQTDGLDIEIAFNPKYLIDILRAMDDKKITMQFTTPISPCIIKGQKIDVYKYLVLPLRLKS